MDFLNTSQYTEAFIYLYEWVKGSSPNFNSHINLLIAPTPKNGQTHSNNLSATADSV